MATNDRIGIMVALKEYKTERGEVNYQMVLSIPKAQRLPEMAKKDFKGMMGMITAALTIAFESMNLKRGMSAIQIMDLAEAILDSSTEDYLAMEDLMLFLQKLTRGEYGAMYESMDIPKFMLAFEIYRQERHETLLSLRENRHLELKGLGGGERSVVKDALDEHFFGMASRLSEMNEMLKSTRKENSKLKDIDKF